MRRSSSVKLRPAGRVGRDHLAIENRLVEVEQGGELAAELIKAAHLVAVARDQVAAAMLEITAGAEAVVFEIEEPPGVVERLLPRGWDDRLHSRKGHQRRLRYWHLLGGSYGLCGAAGGERSGYGFSTARIS